MRSAHKVATNLSVEASLIRKAKPLGINLSRVFEQAKIQATSADPARLVEDLMGTFKTNSIGAAPADAELPITGQFLTRTGIVVLNIGGPSSNRLYAIGDTRREGRHMDLRMFTVRRGHGVNFEKELYFDPKAEPAEPDPGRTSAAIGGPDAGRVRGRSVEKLAVLKGLVTRFQSRFQPSPDLPAPGATERGGSGNTRRPAHPRYPVMLITGGPFVLTPEALAYRHPSAAHVRASSSLLDAL